MRVYLHSLKQLLPPKSVKSREILQKFELIVVQGQVIDLGVNRNSKAHPPMQLSVSQ